MLESRSAVCRHDAEVPSRSAKLHYTCQPYAVSTAERTLLLHNRRGDVGSASRYGKSKAAGRLDSEHVKRRPTSPSSAVPEPWRVSAAQKREARPSLSSNRGWRVRAPSDVQAIPSHLRTWQCRLSWTILVMTSRHALSRMHLISPPSRLLHRHTSTTLTPPSTDLDSRHLRSAGLTGIPPIISSIGASLSRQP